MDDIREERGNGFRKSAGWVEAAGDIYTPLVL